MIFGRYLVDKRAFSKIVKIVLIKAIRDNLTHFFVLLFSLYKKKWGKARLELEKKKAGFLFAAFLLIIFFLRIIRIFITTARKAATIIPYIDFFQENKAFELSFCSYIHKLIRNSLILLICFAYIRRQHL
jgi:hypothetical protein